MARVGLARPTHITDPAIEGIFAWVKKMEGNVPNHFNVELNFPEFFTSKPGATSVLWELGEFSMEETGHHPRGGVSPLFLLRYAELQQSVRLQRV